MFVADGDGPRLRFAMPTHTQDPQEETLVKVFSSMSVALRPDEEETLRTAVCEYVANAKKKGMWPEQIIIAIKRAAASVGHEVSPAIRNRVIEWCLHKYFEDDAK